MNERLDNTCRLPVGTRDSVHVPFVVGRAEFPKELRDRMTLHKALQPGAYVKFIDDKYTKFVLCEKAEAHGVLNPFLDQISMWDPVVVFLLPGITTTTRHTFEIDPGMKDQVRTVLEAQLRRAQEEDPECAECYEIVNNQLIRN